MAVLNYIEAGLGTLFSSARGRDAKLFSRTHAALTSKAATVTLGSEDLGAAPGAFVAGTHDLLGANKFPGLQWSAPADDLAKVKSWVLIVEDADAPLPSPVVHGIYYDIPADRKSLDAADFDAADGRALKGGFSYGANRRGTVWTGPRPVLAHGEHRYFFQIVGLDAETLAKAGIPKPDAGKADLDALKPEHVVCWGEYIATFERKL